MPAVWHCSHQRSRLSMFHHIQLFAFWHFGFLHLLEVAQVLQGPLQFSAWSAMCAIPRLYPFFQGKHETSKPILSWTHKKFNETVIKKVRTYSKHCD